MKWEVVIAVKGQYYAVHLIDKEEKWSDVTGTGKSSKEVANERSIANAVNQTHYFNHDTSNMLQKNHLSRKRLRLFVIKLDETQTTRDTFEIVLDLVKLCDTVEAVVTGNDSEHPRIKEQFLKFCAIEGATLTPVTCGLKIALMDYLDQRALAAWSLINKDFLIGRSYQNYINCLQSTSPLPKRLHGSRFPLLKCNRRDTPLSEGGSQSELRENAESYVRHWVNAYHHLRCVLAIAIFECLQREKLHRSPSIEAIDMLAEGLLQAVIIEYLFEKWPLLSWPWVHAWQRCKPAMTRSILPRVSANSQIHDCSHTYLKAWLKRTRSKVGTFSACARPRRLGGAHIRQPLPTETAPSVCCDQPCTANVNERSNYEVLQDVAFTSESPKELDVLLNAKNCSVDSSQPQHGNAKGSTKRLKPPLSGSFQKNYCLPKTGPKAESLNLKVASPNARDLTQQKCRSIETQCTTVSPLPTSELNFSSSFELGKPYQCFSDELNPQKESGRAENPKDNAGIGIVAASCRLPGGVTDDSELWDLLKSGRNTASRIPGDRIATRDTLIEGKVYGVPLEGGNFITEDISGFDPSFFGISISEAENMDPQQRLLLECVQECLENAGVTDTSNVGVFVGLMETEYPEVMKSSEAISSLFGCMYAFASGRISYVLGSHGPSMTVDTACSSSLVAVDLAINALRNGRCSSAIVAGVNLILSEKGQGARANGNMLSRHGMSLSFDARASGYGRSDGCVVLMLEQIKPGKVYMSEIAGTNVNHGGRSVSLSTPNPQAHKLLINSLTEECACKNLQYWEAHGTGTRVGDRLEMKALSSTFHELTVGSAKSAIGHSEAASGASALLKLVLMMKNNYIPPQVNFHVTSSKMEMGSLILPVVGEERVLQNCGMSSFGVSGTNAAAIVTQSSNPPRSPEILRRHYFVPISAKSMESLNMMLEEIKSFLLNSNENMEDIAGAFAFHKNHYSHRCAVVIDRQGRERQKLFGTCHKGAKSVALILSNADISYDMIQLPGFARHFDSLFRLQDLNYREKLLICFIRFAADIFRSVEIFVETHKELILALVAFSFLPESQVSRGFLQLDSLPEILKELAKFDIYPSSNAILGRYIASSTSDESSMFKIHCDRYSTMTHYNFILISAHLYTKGFDLDFSCLYSRPLRYVKIPTYSFNRRSLWYIDKPQVFDHYLLGMIKEETKTSVTFRNWLDNLRHPHLFKGNSIGIGTAVEIAITALSRQSSENICIIDIRMMPAEPVSPCLLETEVRSVDDFRMVSAQLDKHQFFICIATAMNDIEMKALNTKLHQLHPDAKDTVEMWPLVIPQFKKSRIFMTEDLSRASVNIESKESAYSAVIEVSLRMNPTMVLSSVQCISNLPSSFELMCTSSGNRALVVVRSQHKPLMLVYLCLPECSSSTAYLEKVLNFINRSTENLPQKSFVERRYEEYESEAFSNFRRYNDSISELLCYSTGQKISLGDSSRTMTLLGMKHKGIIHPKNSILNDAHVAVPSTSRSMVGSESESVPISGTTDELCRHDKLETRAFTKREFHDQKSTGKTHANDARKTFTNSKSDRIMEAVLSAAQDVLSEEFPINRETLSMGFVDIGLDSLNLVEFVSRLNQKYFPELNITTADVFDYPTIKQLAEYIKRAKKESHTEDNDKNFTNCMDNDDRGKLSKCETGNIRESILNAVQDVLSQTIPIDGKTLSMGFVDIGLDSLNLVEFVSRLNQKYFPELNISTADIFDYPTIEQLAEYIKQAKKESPDRDNDRGKLANCKHDEVLKSILNAAQDVLSQEFPINEKTLSMGFTDIGLDSLNMVEFVSRLNHKYFPELGISIADVFDYPTIEQLAEHIQEVRVENSRKSHHRREFSGRTETHHNVALPNSKADEIIKSVSSTGGGNFSNCKSDKDLEAVLSAAQDVLSQEISIIGETLFTNFVDLGLDSLNMMEFVNRLNQKYFPELNISTADVFDNPTIQQLVEHIRNVKANSHKENHDERTFSNCESNKILGAVQNADEGRFLNCMSDKFLEAVMNAAQDVLSERIWINGETLSMGFVDLGLDSLNMVEFVNRLNQKYFPELNISTADVFDYPTIKQLAEHIRKNCVPSVSKNTVLQSSKEHANDFQGGVARNLLPESYAYIEVFEKDDDPADILLTSSNRNNLRIVNLHDGSQLQFDSQSFPVPNFSHLITDGVLVKFHSEATVQPRSLFSLLLLFAHQILSTPKLRLLRVFVSNEPTLPNALARSFFKTLAAEKYPRIQYIYKERLLNLRLKHDEPTSNIGGNWLITGGLSGIGLTIAKWLLYECSVENIVLISRRVPDKDLAHQLNQLQQKGNIKIISASITDSRKLQSEFSKITFKINGVIHSAGVVRDSAVERQTLETFSEVFAPKGDGYHVIDNLLQGNGHELDHFIVMSSFTVICGNVGQLNYGVSNAYLDHQMYLRRLEGKPGTTIHWGNWLDTGMARRVQSALINQGFLGLTNKEALKYLAYAIIHKPYELTVANVDWSTVLKNRPDIRPDIVMEASERNTDFYKDSKNRQEFHMPLEFPFPKQKEAHIVPERGDPQQKRHLYLRNDSDEISEHHSTVDVNMATKPTRQNSPICNLLGLNVFFNNEDDFCKSIGWHIKALSSTPSLPLPSTSSKSYVLHVMGRSLTDVETKLRGLFYRTYSRNCRGKSVMMFAGQGAQYPFMGKQLSTMFPVFRNEYENCLRLANTHRANGVSLLEVVDDHQNALLLQSTSFTQPIIFAFGYAVAMLWRSFGFQPDFYLGHSVGELVAGVVAGILTLEEGVRIVVERGAALEKIAGRGALLAIDSRAQKEILEKFKVHLAAVNSARQVVIAGTQHELLKVFDYMKAKNIRGKLVNPKYPFHSPLIREEDLEGLKKVLGAIKFKEARVPILSNVTGEVLNTFSADYLIHQTVSPVQLVKCIRTLETFGVTTWLEAGPASTMTSFLRSTLDIDVAKRSDILQTASNRGEDAELVVNAALALERQNVPISWPSMYQCEVGETPMRTTVLEFPLEIESAISDEDKGNLQGHYVNKENLVPAVYQIYQLLKWINKGLPRNEYFALADTKFVSPWKCHESAEFRLIKTHANVLKLEVNGKMTCISHVKFSKAPIIPYLNAEEIRKECTIDCDIQQFYSMMATNGLEYHDQFQVIKTLKRSDNCTYSLLQAGHSRAIWTLFDAALHAVCFNVVHRRPDVYFVPIAIREIWMSNETDLSNAKSVILVTKKVAENEKLIDAHACLQVDGRLIFQYKSSLTRVIKSTQSIAGQDNSPENSISETPSPSDTSGPHIVKSNEDIPEVGSGVYIIGYDGTFCFDLSDNQHLWQTMKTGILQKDYRFRECPEQSPALMDIDVTEWDPEFFGISPREAKYVDVLQRFMMKSVVRCLENAGWPSVPRKTGVFMGVSGSDFNNRIYDEMKTDMSGYFGVGSSASCVAGRIAHWLRTEGPAVVFDTACSSSFVALANALDAITQGKCDHAIVGGVNIILHDSVTEVLKNAGVLSAKGTCRVFDAGADGYVRSEAVGCILLSKDRSLAKFRITNWAVGHNGQGSSLQAPNGSSQERLMRSLNAGKVGHVECHGTGTSLGDPIEIRAVSRCYGRATISSVKSLLGHTEAASGITSLMACLQQAKYNYRVPTRFFNCPNPKADFGGLTVYAVGEETCLNRMAVNNFGFSGTNCSIIVEKLPPRIASEGVFVKYHMAPISAADRNSLKAMIEEYKVYVGQSDQLISHICTKLQKSRPSYRYRHCILYDYKRHVIWETGEPLGYLESFGPLHRSHLTTFAYGHGYSHYQRCNQGSTLSDFIRQVLPTVDPKDIPTAPMSPLCFHRFIANSYVCGHSVDWAMYNTEAMNEDTVLPPYPFNNRKYWPFEKQFVYNFPISPSSHKQIYFEKTRLKVPRSQRDRSLFVINVGKQVDLVNLRHCTVPGLQQLESSSERRIVLYHPDSSTVEEALKLISLWQILEFQDNFVLIIACRSNGTSFTEWTALCRTLASERLLPYKFVSYCTHEELESEFSHEDIFECVFYEDSCRYVERLVPLSLKRAHVNTPKHMLITGGTGGIGKRIIDFMNAKKATLVTRNAKNVHIRNGGIPKTFIESDLVTLSLPEYEHYDVVVHCAGVVDNALMASMDYSRFENVCRPKCAGFKTLLKSLKGKKPKMVVVASSVAAILGSRGQANYAFANGLLTSIAEESESPTMVIHWGPWKDTGMLQGTHAGKVFEQLRAVGWEALEPVDALQVLNSTAKNVVVLQGDFELIAKQQEHLRKFLSKIVPLEKYGQLTAPFSRSVTSDSPANGKTSEHLLEEIIIRISGIHRVSEERHTPLMNLGMDSLMLEELRVAVNQRFGCTFKATEIYDNFTLDKLSNLVTSQANPRVMLTATAIEPRKSPAATLSGDIAIIGYSGAFSGCRDVEEFWQNLLAGKECITRKETAEESYVDAAGLIDDIDKFDHNFWKMPHDDASMLDPQLRVFVQSAYQALERAGYVRQRNDLKIGVFAGAEPSEYGDPNEEAEGSLRRLFKLNMKDFVATFTAHMLNLRGPAIGVYSACSTALVAIAQACDSLRLSNVDLAIAGAVSLVLPGQSRYEFKEGLVMSKSGVCKPFDSKADGTIRGSAVGCVVLKKLDKAIQDCDTVHAVIKSYGLSNDGLHKASFMAPNSSGQKECIREALASLNPTDVDRIRYVECHGTGTLVGDEIETESMKSAFGDKKSLTIGSVKANIGHGFAAGGMAGLFKVMKILQCGVVPPQINLDNPQADIPFLVNKKPMALAPNSLGAVSSFGIGGTNVHIILEGVKTSRTSSVVTNPAVYLLPISGSSEKACVAQCRAIAEYLRSRPDVDLEAVTTTLQQKRDHFKYRAAFTVKSVPDAISQLEAFDSPTLSTPLDNSNICFLFAPQGVQYPNMEKASMDCAEAFREELERLIGLASQLFQMDFMEIMYPKVNTGCSAIMTAKYAQVALFIISKAVLAQMDFWGISSNFLVGHSVGEYAAACYAGIVDEFSCMKLLKERGDLVSTTKEARMLAIVGSIEALPNDVEVTAHLSDRMKCLVGPPASIEALKDSLTKKEIAFRELTTEHGFHSSMMDCLKNDFIRAVRKISFRKGTKQIVSNINGQVITEFDYNYCWDHMRSPVDLKKCLDTVLSNKKIKLIIEIGPAGIVKHLLTERSANVHVVSTILGRRRATERPSHSQLLQSLADLWKSGYNVDFRKIFGGSSFDTDMPVYQFDRITCWKERIIRDSTARYFKASWSLSSNIKKGQIHKHQEKTLIISNSKQNANIDCCICEIHLTKPSEVFAMTTEELTDYSLLVYIADGNLANITEPFLLSLRICQAIAPSPKSRFLVVSTTGDPIHWTTVGPIKQYHLGGRHKNIFVDNTERIPLGILIDQVLSANEETEEVLLTTPGYILNMTYTEVSPAEKNMNLGETVVVIGGSGAIGSAYVDVLRKRSEVRNIVVTSRNTGPKSTSGVSYVSMDLGDKASVARALDEVRLRYGTINSIIHAAGVPTVPSLTKTTKDVLRVLQPKVVGTLNILEYLSENNLMLDNFVMASSLSSVITLQGTEDYAAANLFMDALALKGHADVKRILAVQWPSWKDVGMASSYENSTLRSIISKASISALTGKRVIKETLGMSGVVAYSPLPPPQMARMVEEIQTNGSTGPLPTVRENLSLTDKVISIWSEILCTNISYKSDFFDNGGNSLSALKVVWSLNKLLSTNISVDLLFKYPTLNKFVKMLPQDASKEMLPAFDPTTPADLTYSQENMYLLRQLETGSHYNIIFSIYFRRASPSFSFAKMIYSIHSLIARQHSLRTSFVRDSSSSKPKQVVHSLTECYQHITLEEMVDDILSEEESFNFDLEDIPLRIRGGHSHGSYVIVFNQHHIVTDGWSVTVLAEELKNIYSAYSRQEIAKVKPLSYSMSEYAQVQRRTVHFTQKLKEFKESHEGREATTLPQRRTHLQPPGFKQIVQFVPKRLVVHVKTLARAHQTTEFVVVLSAFIISLRRLKSKGHDDSIVLGYPVSGRNDEVKDLIGYFLNNVVLAVDVRLQDTLEHVIPVVKVATTSLKGMECVPFHELAAVVNRHHRRGNHLFEIFFNYRHQLDFPTTDYPDADVEIVQASMNKIFDLSVTFDELPEGTRVLMEYNSSRYRTDLIQDLVKDMLRNFQHRSRIGAQPCIPRIDYPQTSSIRCLSNLQQIGDRVAIRERSFSLSYQSLYRKMCEIAEFINDSWMKSTGCCVRCDDVVTLDLDSNSAVVVILAVLKLGAAYAPMDKTWPESRKAQIVANVGSALSISDSLVETISKRKHRKRRIILNTITSGDLMYVIHTSGSQGVPKGVAVSHRNVSAFLRGATPQAFLRPGRTISHSVNVAFDVSVFNIFGSVANSCELCLHKDIRRLPNEVGDVQCDVVFLTSAMLDALTESELSTIQVVEKLFVGGDTVHDRNLAKVLRAGLDVTQIYGPTEGTVWSLTNRCKAIPEEGSFIGKPMLNETCWIDQGVTEGELILSGAKIARGYFNSPNDDRFHRLNALPCYRTGDIVREEKEGFIYRGRLDSQMKVRGHRVEGGEVERAILEATSEISDVKVVVLDEALIAFIVHEKPLEISAVLLKLGESLPSYMVPSRFIRVPEIPLNTSGKANKEKLLEEYSRATGDILASTASQMSVTEQKVALIFENLLNVRNVKCTDNFFALGGHSLLLFELKSRLLTEFGVSIEVHDLFSNLTVQGLARLITEQSKDTLDKVDISIIRTLYAGPEPKFSIYLIHAVGGSTFPYYAFLQIFPKTVNIYAIEYQLHFEADTLKQLAAFYAKAIAAHTGEVRPFLMGHSMGGTISNEIVTELKLWGWEIPFVVMFDTWKVQNFEMEQVAAFAKKTFSALPDYAERAQKVTRLADMLRKYAPAASTTKIFLFKSAEVSDDEAFRRIARPDLNGSVIRAITENGLSSSFSQPVDVWLIDGNHETCMKPENLITHKKTVLSIFHEWL